MQADALFAQAFKHHQGGRPKEAETLYRQVLALNPRHADALLNLGTLHAAAGRPEQAAQAFTKAVELRPSDGRAWANLGVALRQSRNLDGAVEAYGRALRLDPRSGPLRLNLGNLLLELHQPEAALAHFQTLPQLIPDRPRAWLGMAQALKELDRIEEALDVVSEVLKRAPGLPEALLNQGALLLAANRPAEAEVPLRQVWECSPEWAEAEYALGIARLTQGDLPTGFAHYEARWRRDEQVSAPITSSAPRWQSEALKGRTLLILPEQGMGDLIQMSQLLRRIQGGQVILQVWPSLVELLSGVTGADRVISSEDAPPAHDFVLPALSLPLALNLKLPELNATGAYVFPDQAKAAAWREKLLKLRGRRVGLCWRGRSGHTNDRRRSMAPAELAAVARLPSFGWASLQKDASAEELKALGNPQHLGAAFTDFSDTAAAIASLDLVLTVDTSIAHLAGSLGKPTWLLLPFAADWRWLQTREDSPWYPSLRLFRQTSPGDWKGVTDRVEEALLAIL